MTPVFVWYLYSYKYFPHFIELQYEENMREVTYTHAVLKYKGHEPDTTRLLSEQSEFSNLFVEKALVHQN